MDVFPALAFPGCRIITEPWFWLAVPIEAVPVQVGLGQIKFLFFRGENVAVDQAIEFPVRKMIGVLEHDAVFTELVQRVPEELV